jgi:hypothetical protein
MAVVEAKGVVVDGLAESRSRGRRPTCLSMSRMQLRFTLALAQHRQSTNSKQID